MPRAQSRAMYLAGGNRNIWKRRRIQKQGLAADLATKAAARAACEQAIAQHAITQCTPGKPPETTRGHKFDRSGHILRG